MTETRRVDTDRRTPKCGRKNGLLLAAGRAISLRLILGCTWWQALCPGVVTHMVSAVFKKGELGGNRLTLHLLGICFHNACKIFSPVAPRTPHQCGRHHTILWYVPHCVIRVHYLMHDLFQANGTQSSLLHTPSMSISGVNQERPLARSALVSRLRMVTPSLGRPHGPGLEVLASRATPTSI